MLTLHTAKAVGFLSGERPPSISVSGNPQAKGCAITPSHMVLRHRAHVPTWAAYLLPVRQFLFHTLMVLPGGRDGFATGTPYHDVHRNEPTTSGMGTAHTFDYTANWLLLPSPKGDAGQRGLSDGFFCKYQSNLQIRAPGEGEPKRKRTGDANIPKNPRRPLRECL
jgi:hypothetical protein